MIVSYLPEREKHPLWPAIEELLRPAGGPVVPNELVWIAFDGQTLFGAGTTILYENGEAQIRLCGGHRHREWVEQAEGVVSAWARDCGAAKLTMQGRKGWARYFRAFGWVVLGTEDGKHLYEKAL